jgi:hypothetical protein
MPCPLKVFVILTLVSSVFAFGCAEKNANVPVRRAKIDGRIIVSVFQAKETPSVFVVVPSSGSVTRISEGDASTKSHIPEATAINQGCLSGPTVYSPDRKFSASCTGDIGLTWNPNLFRIARANSNPQECQGLKGRDIEGFMWSPDSKAVAVVANDVYLSVNPRFWFYALSGHPVQFETHYLNIVDATTLAVASYRIPLETCGGSAALVRWEQP